MKKIAVLILVNLFFFSIITLYAAKFDDTVIEGWSLEKIEGGKADRATFGSKRIGFFNLAAIKIVNLENVLLIIYKNGGIVKNQRFSQAVYELNSRRLFNEQGDVVFKEN